MILQLNALADHREQLASLLQNCVASGASVGFLPPLIDETVQHYWHSVEADLAAGERSLWIALDAQAEVVGAVQLSYCKKANGRHRAEVEKLMVHTSARGRGIAKKLMAALEQEAQNRNLKLIVLDTRLGDPASSLYRQLGYIEAGQIPDFALSATGKLDPTVLFYKRLTSQA